MRNDDAFDLDGLAGEVGYALTIGVGTEPDGEMDLRFFDEGHRDDADASDLQSAPERVWRACRQHAASRLHNDTVIGNQNGAGRVHFGSVVRLVEEPQREIGFAAAGGAEQENASAIDPYTRGVQVGHVDWSQGLPFRRIRIPQRKPDDEAGTDDFVFAAFAPLIPVLGPNVSFMRFDDLL